MKKKSKKSEDEIIINEVEDANKPVLQSKIVKPVPLIKQIETLNQQVNALQQITEKQKSKAFKLKFPIKFSGKRAINLWKKNKILVISLKNDKVATPVIGELKDGNCIVDGIHHDGGNEFVWLWRGKVPIMIIPQWDINPIGTKQYIDALKEGRTSYHQRVTIRALQAAKQDLEKKRLAPGMIIWIGIAAIIIGYLIFSNVK